MISIKRALVAQHRMPEFDRERGSLRVLEVIEHLLADGWSVTYLSLTEPTEDRYVRHLARLGVETLVGIEDNVRARISALDPDLAIIAFWHVAAGLTPILRAAAPRARIVVDTIDLHLVRNCRRRVDEVTAATPWIDATTADEIRRELNAYSEADAVLTVSDDEAGFLTALAGSGIVVHSVPLGERISESVLPFEQRQGIVFVGNFRHLPNIEAVVFLCQEVLPRLDPDLLLAHPVMIVGNELDDRVRAAARLPGVRLVGWVPDVSPYLHQARIAVAPLLHGAGVKGKVLQSLMAGTPTVATPLAIEGTVLRDGEHLLVGASPADFARAITTLLTDADEWHRISAGGRVAVSASHSTQHARTTFLGAVADVLSRPARAENRGTSRRWADAYARVTADVASLTSTHVTPEDTVLVVSGGDEELVRADGFSARHFPADGEGRHSFHPIDGAAAVSMLDAQRVRGASHFVLPSTAYWWLHRYPELHAHLQQHWTLVAELDEARLYAAARSTQRPESTILVIAQSAASELHQLTVVSSMPDEVARFERVVVAPGHRLEARWLDRLLGLQSQLGLDVAQAAAPVGTLSVPPAAVQQRSVRARRTRAVTTALPVVFVRRAFSLLGRLFESRRVDEAVTCIRFGIVDDCVIAPVADPLIQPIVVSEGATLEPADAWAALDVSIDGFVWQGVPQPAGHRRLSVVIATYQRAALLDQCLGSLVDQSLSADEWEVVVVDDGSTDATPEVIRRWAGALPLRWVRINHAGRSAAKNAGILVAAGDIVLMLDDDDVADGDLLLEHVKAHDEDPDPTVAVLGYTDWAAGVAVTPLMRFITEGATMLFAYHEIADGDRVGWRYFWEGRLSCKRSTLLEFGLHDQRLAYTIDIELGFRLAHGPGLTVVHRRTAISHMARPITYDEFLARSEAKGHAQHRFAALHPTPEVRAYCHVDTAERDWAAAESTFDADRQRIARLESIIHERPDVAEELHQLYVRTLRGANRRAILQAAHADAEQAAAEQAVVPVVSIVIPVWSVTPELAEMAARTIDRIWEVAQLDTEVIVIDNGSPHKAQLDATIVLTNERNEGVAPAWNTGIAAATADTIIVLNSDVTVEAGWDVELHRAASSGRRIAFPHTDHADGLGPRRSDQAGTAGWCFALSRGVIDEIGLFDESFRPAFFEDADYWTRAHAAGVDLTPVPTAVVRHARRSTARHQPGMDLLFQAHRMKFSWKYDIEPTAPPPYWHREITNYE